MPPAFQPSIQCQPQNTLLKVPLTALGRPKLCSKKCHKFRYQNEDWGVWVPSELIWASSMASHVRTTIFLASSENSQLCWKLKGAEMMKLLPALQNSTYVILQSLSFSLFLSSFSLSFSLSPSLSWVSVMAVCSLGRSTKASTCWVLPNIHTPAVRRNYHLSLNASGIFRI